jgi:Na+/alanine symporter
VFIIAIPNLAGLYLLAPIVKKEIARYEQSLRE